MDAEPLSLPAPFEAAIWVRLPDTRNTLNNYIAKDEPLIQLAVGIMSHLKDPYSTNIRAFRLDYYMLIAREHNVKTIKAQRH